MWKENVMASVKTRWTIPREKIKTVECMFCENETGTLEWAGEHLAETKHHYKTSFKDTYRNGKPVRYGIQFLVIERFE